MTNTRIKPEMRDKARDLRKHLTKGEVLLWLELRALKIDGIRFRKQAPIGPYIVDFVCLASKLIVEVDGDRHETADARRHDANRDEYLRKLGYEVMRVDEPDVLSNAWHVAREVGVVAARRDPTRPLRGHPPLEGEGSRPANPSPENHPR